MNLKKLPPKQKKELKIKRSLHHQKKKAIEYYSKHDDSFVFYPEYRLYWSKKLQVIDTAENCTYGNLRAFIDMYNESLTIEDRIKNVTEETSILVIINSRKNDKSRALQIYEGRNSYTRENP